MDKVIMIGLDIAKNVFQVHVVDAEGAVGTLPDLGNQGIHIG